MVLEVVAIRRLYGRSHLDHVLGTFGLLLFFNELVRLVWGPAGMTLPLPPQMLTAVQIIPGETTALPPGHHRRGAGGRKFEPATFAEYAVRADRSARLTPYNPQDAIFSAARMLCADGARGGTRQGVRGAIFAYNHAHWYVRDVLAIAGRYTAAAGALGLKACRTVRHHGHHRRWGRCAKRGDREAGRTDALFAYLQRSAGKAILPIKPFDDLVDQYAG